MKIALIILRVLIGLLFTMSSIVYFFDLVPVPELTGAMKLFDDGIKAGVYLMPLVKTIELTCGLLFIVGRYMPLATVVIFPIVVNILGVHAFLMPDGLPVAIFLFIGNLFLAYTYRENYRGMFVAK